MAIDETPVRGEYSTEPSQGSKDGIKFVLIYVVLAALVVGEFFAFNHMSKMREHLTTQQTQLRDDVNAQLRDQVSRRLAAIEEQSTQELDALKSELDDSAKRMGAQGGELKRARTMVRQLQDQQKDQTAQLEEELSQKADQEQVGALTQDMSSTKTDLSSTKQDVTKLASDLGMARSEMGNLIARNHDDIEYLRKMGDRDYFEFTLTKSQPIKVGGVGLTLKKTNPKRYRFSLDTLANDMAVERKDCAANEPVDFFVNGSKKPYELVVNSVGSNQVKGYLSTPKGSTEVAASAEGAR